MTELLLELFSEEIPARMQIKAADQMLASLEKELKTLEIEYNTAECFVTPRRIALHINGLPKILPKKIIERKGPKITARPEAIEGFLKSTQMKLDELEIIDGLYYAKKTEEAKAIDQTLKNILERLLVSFTWPKSMRLNSSRIRWVRPLRNILCLFADKILPITFGNLESNNHSFGHRFMAPQQLKISSFADYTEKMRNAYVILSSQERENIILKQITEITKDLDLIPVLEEGLLSEVVGLVEYPNTLLGKIDPMFTHLPKEVLVSAMKTHQRYFYLEDKKGKIAPYFLVVANVKHQHDDLIRSGNEKVLKARLADAEFFWQQDLKQPSSANLAKLDHLVFHNKLGTMLDKTNRMIELSECIATQIGSFDITQVKKAALLSKTDLVSEMVGEFPELQGIIGKYYAEKSGEESEVSLAISEHYRPNEANDIGDISKLGAVISIADKLDSIVGLWLAGEKPTSSKDPFALRRAALGIIKLIRYHKFDLSISDLLDKTAEGYNLEWKVKQEILYFFNDRLKYYLKGESFRHDLIMAILSKEKDNINQIITRLEELQNFMTKPKAQELVFSIKRILNILSNTKDNISLDVQANLLNPIETALYKDLQDRQATLDSLANLVEPITLFFEKIMVNDPDPKLKQNRLNLLYNIINLSNQIADFSLIEV